MSSRTGTQARLVLIRHAETVGNLQGVWTGWADTPLSDLGREQVRRTASRFGRDAMGATALYTSPLGRAWQTAVAIGAAAGLVPMADDGLKEMHFGELESIQSARFEGDYPEIFARWRDRTDESFGWPGGESRHAFRDRVAGVMAQLADRHLDQTVLLVVHSGVIRMALAHFCPRQYGEWWHHMPGNCSLSVLELDPAGRAQVPLFNDSSHLTGMN